MITLDAGEFEYSLRENAPRPPAARSAAADGALPRQLSINSNGNRKPIANRLTPYRAKKRFAVQKDVEGFTRQWGGEDYCAELTLTFAENITEKPEASRRFNSLRPALRAMGILSFIGCWERQTRGAWHLHLVIALAHAVRNQPNARVYLQGLRDTVCGTAENEHRDGLLLKRGFGYIHHLAPIRKTAARFAGYFTSYLTKTWTTLNGEKKRVRLITYARNVVRCASVTFGWNGPRSQNWRHRAELWAKSNGCQTPEACIKKFGAKWEYKSRKTISEMVISSYRSDLCDVADNFRFIPFEEAFMMGSGAFEYWQKIRLKEGLSITILQRNWDGTIVRTRTDRKAGETPF